MHSRTKAVAIVVQPVVASVVVLRVQARAQTVKVVVASLLNAVKVVVKADAASTVKAVVVHVVKMAVPQHHVVVTYNRR